MAPGLFINEESCSIPAIGSIEVNVESLAAELTEHFVTLFGVETSLVVGAFYVAFGFSSQIHLNRSGHQVVPVFIVQEVGCAEKHVTPPDALVIHHDKFSGTAAGPTPTKYAGYSARA